MEQTGDMTGMLDLMVRPAFCVKDGVILRVNYAAERHMIAAGSRIADLLVTGKQEYEEFKDGCLYLTLTVSGENCGASVNRMDGFDVFLLDQEEDQADLQAMALAAQELRQPLASVMTVADQLFPISGKDDDPALQEQVARINRGLFQMLRIVSNMSDAYRYCQELNCRQETRDICSILEEVFRKAAPLVKHADIDLHYTGLAESLYCLVDAEKLERAVNNVISNAIKFSAKGGTIDAKLTKRGHMLYLTIQHGGSTIPENLRSCVFSRFRREPSLEDSRFGIGLGMVLIRSAAAQHGGTVLMEYPKEGGARTTMTLAIRQNRDAVVRSNILSVDYAGERDHQLIELSETLPAHLYEQKKIN